MLQLGLAQGLLGGISAVRSQLGRWSACSATQLASFTTSMISANTASPVNGWVSQPSQTELLAKSAWRQSGIQSGIHVYALASSFTQLRGFSAQSAPPGAGTTDSLSDALMKIVNSCVDKVEKDDMEGAIKVLKDGIAQYEPQYAGRPEIGEMHNQLSLLLYFSSTADEAAPHAEVAYQTTKTAFGDQSPLTGHRMVRLGVVRFAQGKLTECAKMLTEAKGLIKNDSSSHEIDMYLLMTELAKAKEGNQIEELTEEMASAVGQMVSNFGAHSMLLSIAMGNHAAMCNRIVSDNESNTRVYEALYLQHARLLAVLDPNSEDLALCNFKLACFYYAQDMLGRATDQIKNALRILGSSYPDDHSMVMMCKHRMGMVCAAGHDHRAAKQLLTTSKAHFGTLVQQNSEAKDLVALVKEAELGLNIASFWAIGPGSGTLKAKQEVLREVESSLHALAATVGAGHMLVVGGNRYYMQIKAIVK